MCFLRTLYFFRMDPCKSHFREKLPNKCHFSSTPVPSKSGAEVNTQLALGPEENCTSTHISRPDTFQSVIARRTLRVPFTKITLFPFILACEWQKGKRKFNASNETTANLSNSHTNESYSTSTSVNDLLAILLVLQ